MRLCIALWLLSFQVPLGSICRTPLRGKFLRALDEPLTFLGKKKRKRLTKARNSSQKKKAKEYKKNKGKESECVRCHLASAALVLSSKSWKNIRDGGQRRKINPNNLGPAFSLCRRARIDAALVKAQFFFAGATPIEHRIEQTNQTLRWCLAKVALAVRN